jgi:cytochrome P450
MVTTEFNPIAGGMLTDPYSAYRALRETDPVHWSPLMEAWVLTRYDDVVAVLSDPERFSADRRRARNRFAAMARQQEQQFGPFGRAPTMLGSDPPARAVENLRPRIQEIVDGLITAVGDCGHMDVIADLAYPLPVIVIAELLGVPPEDRGKFKRWSDDVVAILGGPFASTSAVDEARKSVEELADYFRSIIAERRRDPRDDLISALVVAEDEGRVLSEDELLSSLMLLLIAGNETTTNLIGNGMLALLQNPGQLRTLGEDLSQTPTAVEEMLRFGGAVQLTGRVAKEDLEIGGRQIKEGQAVLAILAAANRDPAKFDKPEEFDILRHPNEHVAFGDGQHFCLGAPLARAETQIAFASLLRRFGDPRLEASEPEWRSNFILRGLSRLPISV